MLSGVLHREHPLATNVMHLLCEIMAKNGVEMPAASEIGVDDAVCWGWTSEV